MNSNSRDRNRNVINFPKTKKLTREQSKRDSNLLEKSRIRSISTSNILRGRPPLHAAKSKNHTTQSNPASKHARTQTPRVQCPPPPPRDFSKSLPLSSSQIPAPPGSVTSRYKTVSQTRFTTDTRGEKNIFPGKNASTTDFYTSALPCLPRSIFGNKSIHGSPWNRRIGREEEEALDAY